MKFSSFRYLVKQGWHNMIANRTMTLASIGVLTACLFITGIAALLSLNVRSYINFLGSQNVVEIFLNDGVENPEELRVQVEGLENVSTCLYISKAQAVEEMKEELGENADLLDEYAGEDNPNNPLPASLRATVADLTLLTDTVEQMRSVCGEASYKIQAPAELSSVIVSLERVVTYAGVGLLLVLGLVSVVVISNTIRLTVFARRKEINIMKYVGATNAFIRLPFFVEGMTVGVLSGLMAGGVVCGGYALLYQYMTGPSGPAFLSYYLTALLPLESVWLPLLSAFLLFGVLIGSLGCTSSIRKHLKV